MHFPHRFILAIVLLTLTVSCTKKPANDAQQAASAPQSEAPAPAASSEAETEKQAELAKKQQQLDYATMEDNYINDPHAQWASSAKVSSTFGEKEHQVSDVRKADNLVGKVDDKTWTNDNQSLGLDWVEAGFTKPVNATAVRFVFPHNSGELAVSKVELIDEQGNAHVIWQGISDVKPDDRGPRTWFARTFDATPYKVTAAKLTIANNLHNGYKELDAVQLVGQ